MSIFANETLTCPSCGNEVGFAVARSVLADRRPDLRDQILAGSFQSDRCTHCDARLRREPDLTYVDIGRAQWILARPAVGVTDWAALEAQALGIYELAYGSLAPPAAQEIGRDMQVRVVFGWPALCEKVLAREHAIDDVSLECLKVRLMRELNGPALGDTTELRLQRVDGEALVLAWVDADGEEPLEVLTVPRGLLDSIHAARADYAELRGSLTAGPFVDIDRLLIDPLDAPVGEADRVVA